MTHQIACFGAETEGSMWRATCLMCSPARIFPTHSSDSCSRRRASWTNCRWYSTASWIWLNWNSASMRLCHEASRKVRASARSCLASSSVFGTKTCKYNEQLHLKEWEWTYQLFGERRFMNDIRREAETKWNEDVGPVTHISGKVKFREIYR